MALSDFFFTFFILDTIIEYIYTYFNHPDPLKSFWDERNQTFFVLLFFLQNYNRIGVASEKELNAAQNDPQNWVGYCYMVILSWLVNTKQDLDICQIHT